MTHPGSCGVLMPEHGADGIILVHHRSSRGDEVRAFLTGTGSFLVPQQVSFLWVELIGGGVLGGEDGQYVADGLAVSPGEAISYRTGKAGGPGADGEDTSFGPLGARGGVSGPGAEDCPRSSAPPDWIRRLD